jgi:acyl-CoA synthetase (AMP-forming)/AMP-acid ligase II
MRDAGLGSGWLGGWNDLGDKVALVDGSTSLGYAALHVRVMDVASTLRAKGVMPGDRVALVLENSWQYIVCYLATLRAGAVVVPLNPAARERDLLAWLSHAHASLVIAEMSHPAFAALQAAVGTVRVMPLEDALRARSTHLSEALDFRPSDDSPATILFTSGTTGAPKGILLSHGNLRANALAIAESLSLTADDSVVAVLPFTYAYGNSVWQSHLACGARVVIERGFGFPRAVVEAMVRERVTGFAGVPSTYALLLSRVKLDAHDLSALRYVTQAGASMAPALTRQLMAALPGKQVYVMYGQTEATSRLTCLPAQRLGEKIGSVGPPVRGVQIEIRDAAGRARAACEGGDIWVRGPNVMSHYWRDADATDQVLRDGWLKTGDVGHLDEDGYLYISGRRSDMIKVGAHRVSPQDVENVLAELTDVSECAVVGVADDILGEVIKAFIVRPAGSPLQELQVKRHCLEKLAGYKVPKYVEFVPSLPRTATGKVQRAMLAGSRES